MRETLRSTALDLVAADIGHDVLRRVQSILDGGDQFTEELLADDAEERLVRLEQGQAEPRAEIVPEATKGSAGKEGEIGG